MSKICINMANLHSGGGLQVAFSFLEDLILLHKELEKFEVCIFISNQVASNASVLLPKLNCLFEVSVFDVFGLQALKSTVRSRYKRFDVVFTLFGPDYLPFIKSKRLVGFAQPWIIYSDNLVYNKLAFFSRLKTRLGYFLKRLFFQGADFYIVESEHVKSGLIKIGLAEEDRIIIAHNSVSNFFTEESSFCFSNRRTHGPFKLGLISRNYLHKNLAVIPQVRDLLSKKYNKEVTFYVTLTKDEMEVESEDFKQNVVNMGPKSLEQCVYTYKFFDAVFFPSLLECFSVTPLEAMAMGKALFASDMPFNRDVCGDHAFYFDPLSPESAATLINDYIENTWGNDEEERIAARYHALQFSSSQERSLKYIELLKRV